jgi:hypothetical protein
MQPSSLVADFGAMVAEMQAKRAAARPAPRPAPVAAPITTTVDEYTARLMRVDWAYAMSDDHGVYSANHRELERLRALQPTLDPTRAIWRSIESLAP